MTTPAHHHDSTTMPPPEMLRVDPGIHAYVQPDGSWGLSNAGVVAGARYAVVIDTLFTEARNRAFRASVDGIVDVPVTTVLNTHHHGDHTWGNSFYPQAAIIGHERCRDETISTGLGVQSFFPTADFGHIDLVPAFVTLFTGDIAFNGGTPFFIQGSLAGHIAACERVKEFGAERIVPGHGAVCGTEALDGMLAYLRFVQHVAEEGYAAGISPLEAARQADLGEFAGLAESERLVANLHRAYSELRGEPPAAPLPLAGIFAEMVEFNGGPVRCFA